MKIIFPVMGAENIAVSYLATRLKQAGHTVKVAFDKALFDDKQYFSVGMLASLLNERRLMVEAITREKPDVLAMSVFVDNYQWCLQVVREVRSQWPCITVWGGIHATSCPELLLQRAEVDYVIAGEGEEPMVELLEALAQGCSPDQIQNVWNKRDGRIVGNRPRPLMKPSEFPDVDKTLYEKFVPIKQYYMTVTSKGCIASCSYCMQNFLKRWEQQHDLGPFLREKPVDRVIDELKTMKRRYGIRYVDIKNNVLSGSREWYDEFLRRYPSEIGLPFRIMGHPLLFQGDLAEKLKKARCHHIQLGIETMNAGVRREVLLRRESDAQILRALDSIQAAGINFSVDLIVGLPGESEDDLVTALDVLSRYGRLIRASIFWLQYLPEVDITQRAFKSGIIDEHGKHLIEEGLQDHYLSTGSPMEPERKRILKTYQILFRLLPTVPGRLMRLALRFRVHRVIRYVPFQVAFIAAIDVFVSVVRRDYYAKWIMKWYARHIVRRLLGRVDYISD